MCIQRERTSARNTERVYTHDCEFTARTLRIQSDESFNLFPFEKRVGESVVDASPLQDIRDALLDSTLSSLGLLGPAKIENVPTLSAGR